eukprot:scaffold226723_cov48-Prasinocladus_malaysianus.AAC.1
MLDMMTRATSLKTCDITRCSILTGRPIPSNTAAQQFTKHWLIMYCHQDAAVRKSPGVVGFGRL